MMQQKSRCKILGRVKIEDKEILNSLASLQVDSIFVTDAMHSMFLGGWGEAKKESFLTILQSFGRQRIGRFQVLLRCSRKEG